VISGFPVPCRDKTNPRAGNRCRCKLGTEKSAAEPNGSLRAFASQGRPFGRRFSRGLSGVLGSGKGETALKRIAKYRRSRLRKGKPLPVSQRWPESTGGNNKGKVLGGSRLQNAVPSPGTMTLCVASQATWSALGG
jgi:hypothetical protein